METPHSLVLARHTKVGKRARSVGHCLGFSSCVFCSCLDPGYHWWTSPPSEPVLRVIPVAAALSMGLLC